MKMAGVLLAFLFSFCHVGFAQRNTFEKIRYEGGTFQLRFVPVYLVQEPHEKPTEWVFTSQIRCSPRRSSGVECSLENARTP
jgi:hypothetical protein